MSTRRFEIRPHLYSEKKKYLKFEMDMDTDIMVFASERYPFDFYQNNVEIMHIFAVLSR